jgi:hypothetical protein
MSEADRISTEPAEPALEPLGIKEPLRSPIALGQSKFLMPLGLRSLSVLQSIAVHPQVDDFDFSSIQAANPIASQEPESTPNLQLSGLPEPKDAQSDRFKIVERGRPSQINSFPQKPSTPPKSHPGTALPHPVQGVVQFFKSVLGRRDSPAPEQTSVPEFPSPAHSPQPISDVPPLIQLRQGDVADPLELPQIPTFSPELRSASFVDSPNSEIQQRPDSNFDIQREKLRGREPAIQAVIRQIPSSNLDIQQRAEEAINLSGNVISPLVDSQYLVQENAISPLVDSQYSIQVDDSNAIASIPLDLVNAQDLNPQKISAENFLVSSSDTIQLQQKDRLERELNPSFLQNQTLPKNLIGSSEIVANTGLGSSENSEDIGSSEIAAVDFLKIQRQPADQNIIPVPPISLTQLSLEIEPASQPDLNPEQALQKEDVSLVNQDLSVVQRKKDDLNNQDRFNAIDSTFSLLNDVEITTLQSKQENSLEQIFYSLEPGAAEQSESIPSLLPPLFTNRGELEGQSIIQQRLEIPIENGIETAIAFIPEGFIPGIEQQEINQPSLQLKKEHASIETSESFLESTAPTESITSAFPQIQQVDAWGETSSNDQFASPIEDVNATKISSPIPSNLHTELAILQRKSDADDSLSNDASLTDRPSSVMSHSASSITHEAASVLNNNASSIRHDVSLTHHNAYPIEINHDAFLDEQKSLGSDTSSPDFLQLQEERAEILDPPFEESSQTLLLDDCRTLSELSSQGGDSVEAAEPFSLKIQRQFENARFTDAAEVIITEESISSEAIQLGSEDTKIQRQSNGSSDRENESLIFASPSFLDLIEPNISVNSVSFQEADVQRQPTTENTQTVIEQNSAPIHAESHLGTLPYSQSDGAEAEIVTVSSEFMESLETRSLRDIDKRSLLLPNAPITENLSSLEIQRQAENSVSENHVIPENFPDIETENHLKNEVLPTSGNDSGVFIKPLIIEPLIIEPSIPGSLQMKSEQSDGLAVASHLKKLSATESFNLYPEPSTASSHPDSEIQRLPENIVDTPQFTSDVQAVQAASISSSSVNETQADFTFVEERISESTESVPDSVPQSSTGSSIAFSTSENFINSASQSNNSESSELPHSLANLTPNSPNIQRRSEHSELITQNPTLPSNVTLNRAETQLDPTVQSVIEQNDNPLQSSFPPNQQPPSQDLQRSALGENVNFSAESTEKEILSQFHPHIPALENFLENSTPPAIQRQPKDTQTESHTSSEDFSNISLEQHLGDRSHHSEPSTSLESSHPDSDIQSLVESSFDAPDQFSANGLAVQAASISSSSASIGTHENQENVADVESIAVVENIAAVETKKLGNLQSVSDAPYFADTARVAPSTTELLIACSAPNALESSDVKGKEHDTSQNSFPSEDGLGERSIASSHSIENPDPFLTMPGAPEFDIAIQQRPIENVDFPSQLAESEIPSQRLPSISTTENLLPSAIAQQEERPETNSLATNSLATNNLEADSHAFLESSPDIQLASESYSEGESSPVEPLSPRSVKSLPSSSAHPGSDVHENSTSQSFPDIQLELENRFSVEGRSLETLNDLSLGASSEAIAQTFSETAIALPSPSVEPIPQAIANAWDTSSSYDSTPNGRRDAQIAASENSLPVENEISQALPNPLSSDIQRFADGSLGHSSPSVQIDDSDQSDTVTTSSSQWSADLPQLPRFLKNLTVLKPLVQRSPLYELPDELPVESSDHLAPLSFQNSSPTFSSPFSRNHDSAIHTPQLSNIQPALTSAPTSSPATVSSHPGTAPSAWSSLAELVNPKPTQSQQSSSTNHYSPLPPSLIQAKFTTPILQKAPDPNAPIEVPNAPTTTLASNDFQQEADLDALLETLAQEIYGLLRQKMEIERERQGRNLGRMPW